MKDEQRFKGLHTTIPVEQMEPLIFSATVRTMNAAPDDPDLRKMAGDYLGRLAWYSRAFTDVGPEESLRANCDVRISEVCSLAFQSMTRDYCGFSLSDGPINVLRHVGEMDDQAFMQYRSVRIAAVVVQEYIVASLTEGPLAPPDIQQL